MSVLVADISNGRTKLALAQSGCIRSEVRFCPTAELSAARLALLCADWEYESAAFASVVPAASRAFLSYAAQDHVVTAVQPCSSLSVDVNNYPGVATLGADRVANVVAAEQLYRGVGLVIIDAGTATTLDVVLPAAAKGEKPRFLGGAIAPGVGTMVRALHCGTALLPEVPLTVPPSAVGRNTVEALQNGCVRGYRGLLRELLTAMEDEYGCTLRPVLTGGDAPLLARLMPELGEAQPLLTLQGVALCAGMMKKC